MRKAFLAVFTAVAVFALGGCEAHLAKLRPDSPFFKRPALEDLEYGPIDAELPETKRVTLKNGMVVHLLPAPELPLFEVYAMVRTGAVWEPADKTGLASLTGSMIRAGGTENRPPDELDETLEFIAGSVETSIGSESGSASLSVLSKDTDLGLEIFADVLMHPRFDQARFELAKARMLDGIRRENDSPTGAAERELSKLIYEGSPYGRTPTLETVGSITREDVIAFYKKHFAPQNIMIGVTGEFDENEIIARLEKLFAGWAPPEAVTPERPDLVPEEFDGGVWVADKKIPQSVIRMGHLTGLKTDPDYHTLRVMDDILGGSGFTSRLVQSVRTDRGLAYSVWAYSMAGRWQRGEFMAGAETKAASTAQVIELILAEIERIREEPVSQDELDGAKKAIVNRFIFIFDRPLNILKQRMIVDYYGYPDDYLETYRDKVMAVTAGDVLDVAKRRLNPEGLKIVVIGDPSSFNIPLTLYGPVRKLELRDYTNGQTGK